MVPTMGSRVASISEPRQAKLYHPVPRVLIFRLEWSVVVDAGCTVGPVLHGLSGWLLELALPPRAKDVCR